MNNPFDNHSVYENPEIVSYYLRANGLQPCEDYLFDAYIHLGDRVLDIGVGAGRTTPSLSSKASYYVGIDYSLGMVAACNRRFPALEFHWADATDLGMFPDGAFDAVIFSFNGIDYVQTDGARLKCLSEINRVLRVGGRFIFSSHNARMTNLWPVGDIEPGRRNEIPSGAVEPSFSVWRKLRSIGKRLQYAVRRATRRSFYTGAGFAFDPVHGGLWTFEATPKRWSQELARAGFATKEVVSALYPRKYSHFLTGWYYYAAIK